jgi:hypothetical protein
VQRADGQPAGLGQLADPASGLVPLLDRHSPTVRP